MAECSRGAKNSHRIWIFAGSETGGRRAAAIYKLIETAKLTEVDARVWLSDVLARINHPPMHRLYELLPWNWQPA
jgi:transposase